MSEMIDFKGASRLSSCLVDVATLKSTLRALGNLRLLSPEKEQFELDLCNLGKLVEDIVVFDRVFYMNPEEQLPCLPDALGEAISPIRVDDELYLYANELAADHFERCATTEFLTSAVRLVPRYESVEIRSSSYYLYFMGLGVTDKYSALMKSLLFESGRLGDKFDEQEIALAEHYRRAVDGGMPFKDDRYVSPGITTKQQIFGMRLAWLALRSMYYSIVATSYGLTYSPHSLRAEIVQAFHLAVAGLDAFGDLSYSSTVRKQVLDFLATEARADNEVIAEFYKAQLVRIDLPAIFLTVLRKSSSRNEIIPRAIEMRNSKGATAFRERMAALDAAVNAGDLKAMREFRAELQSLILQFKKECGLVEPANSNATLGFGPLGIPVNIKVPRSLEKSFYPRAIWRVFLRDLFKDLANHATLGALREKFFLDLLRCREG